MEGAGEDDAGLCPGTPAGDESPAPHGI